MISNIQYVTIAAGCLFAIGCGPAPQPVWQSDSKSFLYSQADGSVMQFDLSKRAVRSLVGPGDRQSKLVALNPTGTHFAIALTTIGNGSRSAQVGIASLADSKVNWHAMATWGNASVTRKSCSNSCYWCPTGQRILIWSYNNGVVPLLSEPPTPASHFAVLDVKTQEYSELTTAPPAVELCQLLHVSPICPDGTGYLAMKSLPEGAKFYFVSWDRWEYPLVPTAEAEQLIKSFSNHDQTSQRKDYPLIPQGAWSESTLTIATPAGSLVMDVKNRKISLTKLPAAAQTELKEIYATDSADGPWRTVQKTAFKGGELELHYRAVQDNRDVARVEVVDRKLQRRRVLLEGKGPDDTSVHHLFPSPDGTCILACVKDSQTGSFCIHVVRADGTVQTKLDAGRMSKFRTP